MAYAKGDVYPYKKASKWEEEMAVKQLILFGQSYPLPVSSTAHSASELETSAPCCDDMAMIGGGGG
eukprot:1691497-Rhodomonas_salina.1